MSIATIKETLVLIFMIRQINSLTLSLLPWPMRLLTIEDVVAANAHVMQPSNPKMFRITLDTADAVCP